MFGEILGLAILAGIYFAPTIVAWGRKHETASVLVINLFLGWTFVGWVVALAMAVRGENRAKVKGGVGPA